MRVFPPRFGLRVKQLDNVRADGVRDTPNLTILKVPRVTFHVKASLERRVLTSHFVRRVANTVAEYDTVRAALANVHV